MTKNKTKFFTGKLKPITVAIALLSGVAAFFILTAVFSLCITVFENGIEFAPVFANVSAAAGCFVTAFILSLKTGSKGWIIGTVTGVSVFLIVTLISVFANNSGLNANTVFRLAIIILSSLIGGILGVNKVNNKKYI